MTKENWADIHKDFDKYDGYYQKHWKDQNFTYQEAKAWIDINLKLSEAKFASYLKQNNYQPNNLTETKLTELGNEYNQNWLNNKYPQKPATKEIKSDYKEQFHGSLTIADYPQLETIDIKHQENLTQLHLNNCPRLIKLNCNSNKNLTNLTITNCPNLKELNASGSQLSDNKKPKELNISHNKLTNLNINHLKDLETLSVFNNNLTELEVNNCINLKNLTCYDNNLTKLDLTNNLQLEELDIRDNNFPKQDLSLVSHLVNLKRLELGNHYQGKINQNIYNRFTGSLEPLKNLSKLTTLDIDNTDIDSGLEYLPDSIEAFDCWANIRKDAKCKKLYRKLNPILGSKKTIQEWKKANQKLITKVNQKTLQEQLKLLEEEKERLIQRITDLETLTTENQRLIKQQKSKIGENIKNYLPLFEEEDKQTVQRLINSHKVCKEAEKNKQWSEVNKLFKQFISLHQRLEKKLGTDFMEIVTMILTNFEELYQREWDLQEQLVEQEQLPNKLANIEQFIIEINKNIKALETNPKQIVNYITTGDINVQQGSLLIGNTTIEEIAKEKEQQCYIQQKEPFGVPGSSKN